MELKISAYAIPGLMDRRVKENPMEFAEKASESLGITMEYLQDKKRKHERIAARVAIIRRMLIHCDGTLETIGNCFGVHHSTVIYYRDKFKKSPKFERFQRTLLINGF